MSVWSSKTIVSRISTKNHFSYYLSLSWTQKIPATDFLMYFQIQTGKSLVSSVFLFLLLNSDMV